MKKKNISNRIARFLKAVYLKLFRINDSPFKIALGFGLGVFIGVMPGVGPVAALLLAFLLRVNRASALLGSLLFNTWVGLLVLVFAIKVGSTVRGIPYTEIYADWLKLINELKWERLFEASVYDVLIPIGIGYLIISFTFALVAALIVFMIARQIKIRKKSRIDKNRCYLYQQKEIQFDP
jgi:uncharacterized protein (DUF2062 family)